MWKSKGERGLVRATDIFPKRWLMAHRLYLVWTASTWVHPPFQQRRKIFRCDSPVELSLTPSPPCPSSTSPPSSSPTSLRWWCLITYGPLSTATLRYECQQRVIKGRFLTFSLVASAARIWGTCNVSASVHTRPKRHNPQAFIAGVGR